MMEVVVGALLGVAVLAVLCVAILVRVARANSRAKAERLAALAEATKRRDKEREVLERLERIRKTDGLSAAKKAIEQDPVRAARVVSKMMKDKG